MSTFYARPETGLCPVLFGKEVPRVIAVVGAGGKTSAIKTMAWELSCAGKRVVVTTTTKMHPPEDRGLLASTPEDVAAILEKKSPAWAGIYFNEHKIEGIPDALPALSAMADCVLVEADGARKHPLKMTDPAYEPVIPPEAESVIAVAGLDGIGKPLDGVVHRPALACAALGLAPEHIITPADAARLLRHCYAPRLVILNKAETPQRRTAAEDIAALMPEARCVITSLRQWGLTETR